MSSSALDDKSNCPPRIEPRRDPSPLPSGPREGCLESKTFRIARCVLYRTYRVLRRRGGHRFLARLYHHHRSPPSMVDHPESKSTATAKSVLSPFASCGAALACECGPTGVHTLEQSPDFPTHPGSFRSRNSGFGDSFHLGGRKPYKAMVPGSWVSDDLEWNGTIFSFFVPCSLHRPWLAL